MLKQRKPKGVVLPGTASTTAHHGTQLHADRKHYRDSKGDRVPHGSSILISNITFFLLLLLPAILVCSYFHYRLPVPNTHKGFNPVTGVPEFSEYNAYESVKWMGDRIGYRIVGTLEERQTRDFILQQVM